MTDSLQCIISCYQLKELETLVILCCVWCICYDILL